LKTLFCIGVRACVFCLLPITDWRIRGDAKWLGVGGDLWVPGSNNLRNYGQKRPSRVYDSTAENSGPNKTNCAGADTPGVLMDEACPRGGRSHNLPGGGGGGGRDTNLYCRMAQALTGFGALRNVLGGEKRLTDGEHAHSVIFFRARAR